MEKIIQALNELVSLHQELLKLSKQKTEVIKEGEVEKLQSVLVSERKLVRKLEQAETRRMQLVGEWVEKEGLTEEDPTITLILERITNEEERTKLEKVTIELTKAMTDLKAQENLNLALIDQSMQFVQLSLDLLSPSLKNMNYSNNNKPNMESPTRSIFDSKA